MAELLEENRKLNELVQSILPENCYFHETDDAHEVHDKMVANEMPYALIIRKNGITLILNSSDFLSVGKRSGT